MKLLNLFSQEVDFLEATRAPVDTDGARPSSGSLEKELSEIRTLWLSPAIKESDVVSTSLHMLNDTLNLPMFISIGSSLGRDRPCKYEWHQ